MPFLELFKDPRRVVGLRYLDAIRENRTDVVGEWLFLAVFDAEEVFHVGLSCTFFEVVECRSVGAVDRIAHVAEVLFNNEVGDNVISFRHLDLKLPVFTDLRLD